MSDDEKKAAIRWEAVEMRDMNAVGRFVLGVRSTGIFCTPVCDVPPVARQDIEFFDTPALARQNGFDACRTCDPDNAEWLIGAGRWM